MFMERLADYFVNIFNFVYEWAHIIFDVALIVLIVGVLGDIGKKLRSKNKSPSENNNQDEQTK